MFRTQIYHFRYEKKGVPFQDVSFKYPLVGGYSSFFTKKGHSWGAWVA